MTTTTQELIEQINIEANYAHRATDKTGGILYQTLMQAAQRLRELDKPDCGWTCTPNISTPYKASCSGQQFISWSKYCPNCGGAVFDSLSKEST